MADEGTGPTLAKNVSDFFWDMVDLFTLSGDFWVKVGGARIKHLNARILRMKPPTPAR